MYVFYGVIIIYCGKKQIMLTGKKEKMKCVMILFVFSADHPRHLRFFRIHVSRAAAGKGRAVLEGVGLHTATIGPCFEDNPQDVESAVQAGLTKWIEGTGYQPPTWQVLLDAMEYAQIAQQHIQDLKADLGLC